MAGKKKESVKSKSIGDKFLLAVDVVMVVLLIVNLLWLIFDFAFTHQFFRNFLSQAFPPFHDFYANEIHPNFLLYDLYFVAVFVAEILIRWAVAIKNKTYGSWFLYPMVHWYDILGSIPVGAFRWLRLLRFFSISMRLHRLGIINLRETYIWRKIDQVYQIFLEEITDRVLINLLDAIQREIVKESSSKSNVIADVIMPHRDSLSKWITQRIQTVTEDNYNAFRKDLKQQIEHTVREGFASSKGMKRVESIPLVGKQIFNTLEDAISDTAFELIESSAKNVSSEKNTQLMEEGIKNVFDSILSEQKNEEISEIVKDICAQFVEKMKEDIRTKSWMLEKKEEEVLGELNDLLHDKKNVS